MLTITTDKNHSQSELQRQLSTIEPPIETNVTAFLQKRRYQVMSKGRGGRKSFLQIAAVFTVVGALGLGLRSKPIVLFSGATAALLAGINVVYSDRLPGILGKRANYSHLTAKERNEYNLLTDHYDNLAIQLNKISPNQRLRSYIATVDNYTADKPIDDTSAIYLDVELKKKVYELIQNPSLESGMSFEAVRVSKRWNMKRPPKHILTEIIAELLAEKKIIERNGKYLTTK